MSSTSYKSSRSSHHAWVRAEALGYASAHTGTKNPYPYGTYCHTSFNQGLQKALEATAKKTAAYNQ